MKQNLLFAAACIVLCLGLLLCWVFDGQKPRPGMAAGVALAALGAALLAAGAMS